MRITLSSYFQMGFAIGTNDTVFTADKMVGFNYYKGATPIKLSNKQFKNRLGNGIALDMTKTDIFEDWKNGAMCLVDEKSFHNDFEVDASLHHDITQIIENGVTTGCMLNLFSCGIATVEVSLTTDDKANPEALFRFAQMFEYAAYDTYECHTTFHHKLRNETQRILSHFLEDENLKNITTINFSEDDYVYNFFPSFTITFNTTSPNMLDKMHDFRSAHDDCYEKSSVDGNCLYSSWYTLLFESDNENSTVIDLVRIYTLFYGASEMMENIMNAIIYELLSPQANKNKFSQLIKLQLTGNLIINNTNTTILSQDEELMNVLRTLNKNGNIELIHTAIERSLAVCSDIKSQFEHEQEMKNDAEEKKRDDKINFFVILFTSLTFISVACDFLNLDDMASSVIDSIPLRILLYIAVMGTFVYIICRLFKSNKG